MDGTLSCATNTVGRPLFEVSDADLTTIAPGASWSFITGSFDEPYSEYVTFPDVSD